VKSVGFCYLVRKFWPIREKRLHAVSVHWSFDNLNNQREILRYERENDGVYTNIMVSYFWQISDYGDKTTSCTQ
jgi:hypothetical protein